MLWITLSLALYSLQSTQAFAAVAFVSPDRKKSFAFVARDQRSSDLPFRQQCIQPERSRTRLYLERPFNSTSMDYQRKPTSTELSVSFADVANFGYKVYCDMDGVLVDFEMGVRKLMNSPTSELDKRTMWKHIGRANAFFENLSWTKDGKRLWDAIRPLGPNILTGVPNFESSRIEKYNWCKRELGVREVHHVDMAAEDFYHESVNGNFPLEGVTNVITCWSNNKHYECDHRSVLIDDRDCLRETWERAGGIFVHHVDAETTIRKLREHGIL